MRPTAETLDLIALQSPLDAVPEPTIIRTAAGNDLSISRAARQLVEQRKFDVGTIIWGADAIAPYLGRSVKGAYGALEGGRVPGAKKIAGRWALNLRILHASFER